MDDNVKIKNRGQQVNNIFNRAIAVYMMIAVVMFVAVDAKKAHQERARYLVGVFYNENLSNYSDGIVYFDYLRRQRPKDEKNYFFLGYCYLNLGQYDKALAFFERASKAAPQEPLYQQYLTYTKSRLDKTAPEVPLPTGSIAIPLE